MTVHPLHDPALTDQILKKARQRLNVPMVDRRRDARAQNIRADLAAAVNREVGHERQRMASACCEFGVFAFVGAVIVGIFVSAGNPLVFVLIDLGGVVAFAVSTLVACSIVDPPTSMALTKYRYEHQDDMRFLSGLPDSRHPFDDEVEDLPFQRGFRFHPM